jgi:hypothetical protein
MAGVKVVVFGVTALTCLAFSHASLADESLSQAEAHKIAQIAAGSVYPDLFAVNFPQQRGHRDFFEFEILWTDQRSNASPHYGTFAVNARTGDVWNVAGFCTRVSSPKLLTIQQQIKQRFHWKDTAYRMYHIRKPACDAG